MDCCSRFSINKSFLSSITLILFNPINLHINYAFSRREGERFKKDRVAESPQIISSFRRSETDAFSPRAWHRRAALSLFALCIHTYPQVTVYTSLCPYDSHMRPCSRCTSARTACTLCGTANCVHGERHL